MAEDTVDAIELGLFRRLVDRATAPRMRQDPADDLCLIMLDHEGRKEVRRFSFRTDDSMRQAQDHLTLLLKLP